MDSEADDLYNSIHPLLELKQKYAAVFEARYARMQATAAATQGYTIMVFTIVTVIFLPMSFIAAMFAIDIEEFPRAPDGSRSLRLGYVSKYTFGVGLSISIPLIVVALTVDKIGRFYNRITSPDNQGASPVPEVHTGPEPKNRNAGLHQRRRDIKEDSDGSSCTVSMADDPGLPKAAEVSATERLGKGQRRVSWKDMEGRDLEKGRE
jgi:hypothetical protein